MLIKTPDKQILCDFNHAIGTRINNANLIIELIDKNIYLHCDFNEDARQLRNNIFAAADKNKKFYFLDPSQDKYYQIEEKGKLWLKDQ